MEAIANFLAGIGEVLVVMYTYLNNTIQSTVYVVQLLGYFAVNVFKYFSWLPGEFVAIVMLLFQIAVLYKVLGKEG